MDANGLLPKLKAELAKNAPALVPIFTDAELVGMIEEAREWCPPDCADEVHCHVEHAAKIAERVAEEQGLIA